MARRKRGSTPPAGTAGFRRRQVELGDGGKLVLNVNGSITQLDAAGAVTAEWSVDDEAWPRHALRFGLHPQPATIVPEGRREAEPRPRDG